MFESKESAALPTDTETSELNNHVIILGFGRVGQTIAQLLSERLIPFVALDVRGERVAAGQAADLPVYFGDAGSPQVRLRAAQRCPFLRLRSGFQLCVCTARSTSCAAQQILFCCTALSSSASVHVAHGALDVSATLLSSMQLCA